jgi:hypothetical protein
MHSWTDTLYRYLNSPDAKYTSRKTRALSQPIYFVDRVRCDTADAPMEVSALKEAHQGFIPNLCIEVYYNGKYRSQIHGAFRFRSDLHLSGLSVSPEAVQTYHLCKLGTSMQGSEGGFGVDRTAISVPTSSSI